MTYQQRFEHYVGFVSRPVATRNSNSPNCVMARSASFSMWHTIRGASYGPTVEDRERRLAHLDDGEAASRTDRREYRAVFGTDCERGSLHFVSEFPAGRIGSTSAGQEFNSSLAVPKCKAVDR